MLKKLLFLLILSPLAVSCQNSLTGEFSPSMDYDFVILYRLTPFGKVYTTNTKVVDGKFNIKLDSVISKGSYRLVYNLPEESHFFDIIYDGKSAIDFTFSEKSGVVFSDEQNRMLSEYLKKMDSIEKELDSELMRENPKDDEISNLLKSQIELQNKAEKESKDSFASLFIKANKPYIPNDFKNRNVYYAEKKSNYFKNFDFENEQLQSSSFPLKKITSYYNEFITAQGPSFYRSLINDIYFELRNCDLKFQKTVLANFWQVLVDNNKHNAANYLAENYLIELANSANDPVLAEKIELFKSLSIGAKAPDFSWENEDGKEKTLYTTEGSEYYILAFWSSECSHCMEQMPVLNEKMKNISDQKIKVIAIGLEMDEQHWKETIPNLSQFIHLMKIGEDRAGITLKYNITGTPTFIVLDKDEKIIAKPRGEKSLFGIIDQLEAYKE